VYAECGPKQYRFTIYSENNDLLHDEFKNDRFGCDPCPMNYHYVHGYQSSRERTHIGTSLSEDVGKCEQKCDDSKSCKSFSYSYFDQTCKIFSAAIMQPTSPYNKLDYATCTQAAGCCRTMVISSTGGTAEFQSVRLGTYVEAGRYNNRPWYRQEGGTKILYYAGYQEYGWVVASSVDSLGGLRTLASSSSQCPENEIFWDYYTGNKWVFDEHLTVSCQEESCKVKTRDGNKPNALYFICKVTSRWNTNHLNFFLLCMALVDNGPGSRKPNTKAPTGWKDILNDYLLPAMFKKRPSGDYKIGTLKDNRFAEYKGRKTHRIDSQTVIPTRANLAYQVDNDGYAALVVDYERQRSTTACDSQATTVNDLFDPSKPLTEQFNNSTIEEMVQKGLQWSLDSGRKAQDGKPHNAGLHWRVFFLGEKKKQ